MYYFAEGNLFKDLLSTYLVDDNLVNNEFYLAPLYNEYIARSLTVSCVSSGVLGIDFFGLGTPEDYEFFHSLEIKESLFQCSEKPSI